VPRILYFPRALWLAVALAIALPLPSLFAELYSDDQTFVVRLEGAVPLEKRSPLALYTFAYGDAGQRARVIDRGTFPWWTLPDLRLAFFRPLASALFALDHAVAGRHALPYHVQSIAWYVAAVLAAAALARRILPERVAAAATLLFAIAPVHWMAAAWPSARHVAIGGAFGLAAVARHVRARTKADARSTLAALACGALALLASESALGAVAYIGAYELFGRDDRFAARVRAFAPWLALVAVYLVVYRVGGYGVYGAGGYVDPLGEPATFLASLPLRLGVLACAALLGVPAEMSLLAPRAAQPMAIAGGVALVVFGLLVRRALRRMTDADARAVKWILAGAVLAVLPSAAGIAGDRGLFMPSFGTAVALAVVFLHAGRAKDEASRAIVPRLARAPFALVHMVLAAPVFVFGVITLLVTSRAAMSAAKTAEIPSRANARVVGIGLSDPLVGMYLGTSMLLTHDPAPASIDHLSLSAHDHRVRRTDASTLEIAPVDGAFLEAPFEYLVRAPRFRIHAGDTFRIATGTVRVLADDGALPTRIAVTFDRPLPDPDVAFVVWRDNAIRSLTLPEIGDEIVVRHEAGPMGRCDATQRHFGTARATSPSSPRSNACPGSASLRRCHIIEIQKRDIATGTRSARNPSSDANGPTTVRGSVTT
jgi:hypothetical protein